MATWNIWEDLEADICVEWDKHGYFTVIIYKQGSRSQTSRRYGDEQKAIAYAKRKAQEWHRAHRIVKKWLHYFGWGFHPDNTSDDYTPEMTDGAKIDYDRNMITLKKIPDWYNITAAAMENYRENYRRERDENRRTDCL